ncbi:hypothetical protein DM860_002572 [Cuscuta australis]|uniref:Uncharacterized protein n=1 Tax=Cuscuta australis TaxID=267555 RepID=A0A328CZ88_9ASTE|nr:hypothetical protein DM860_002572 [Cuscuta australis]
MEKKIGEEENQIGGDGEWPLLRISETLDRLGIGLRADQMETAKYVRPKTNPKFIGSGFGLDLSDSISFFDLDLNMNTLSLRTFIFAEPTNVLGLIHLFGLTILTSVD